MREGKVRCLSTAGFHKVAYVEWGHADNPKVLVCVHGLTRNGRDFDFLAQALEADYRVICPDIVGRGKSDWLANKSLYVLPQYCADMVTLLAWLNVETVDWLGTSMGGLIGMTLAAQPGNPIRRLVLNDVGPVITGVSLARIGDYLGKPPRFDRIEEAEAYVRQVSAPFGPLTDTQWRHLTVHAVHQAKDGKIEFVYDPGIAQVYRQSQLLSGGKDVELWPLFDAITCPTLLLRGEKSDILEKAAATKMAKKLPNARVATVAKTGHAPALDEPDSVAALTAFLSQVK